MREWFVIGGLAVAVTGAYGQGIDPRGVFFSTYSGPENGTEWSTMWDAGPGRYEYSDLRATAPYSGTIGPDGATVWDTGATGSGQFDTSDHGSYGLSWGGASWEIEQWRAPGTTADFITQIQSAEQGDVGLVGTWRLEVQDLDVITGEVLGTRTDLVTLTVIGTTVRLTESDGAFYQGVFETATSVGFRAISPDSAIDERFKSFEGSLVSAAKDTLGDLHFSGDGQSFEGMFLFENRFSRQTPVKDPTLSRFVATKVPTPGAAMSLGLAGLLVSRRRRG